LARFGEIVAHAEQLEIIHEDLGEAAVAADEEPVGRRRVRLPQHRPEQVGLRRGDVSALMMSAVLANNVARSSCSFCRVTSGVT
jgi:hypothetical protein